MWCNIFEGKWHRFFYLEQLKMPMKNDVIFGIDYKEIIYFYEGEKLSAYSLVL